MADSTTDRARATLGRQIRHGVSWNAANLVVNKGMSILVRLFLARLLIPEHFGLIAMIVVLLGLVKIFVDRGGSVDLNRFRAFSKWFSALVTRPPLRASAG